MVDSCCCDRRNGDAKGGKIVQPIGVDAPEITRDSAIRQEMLLGLYQQPKQQG